MDETTSTSIDTNDLPLEQGSPALQGEQVSFTGTLASMTHQTAMNLVTEHGGVATTSVSQKTTMLVVGEEGWPLETDGSPSQKLQQVMTFQAEGLPVQVVNESDWLNLIGLQDRMEEVRRLYTPAMLSQLLGVSVHTIRGWERSGLIRAERRLYRLPYFDFQEVMSARLLTELLEEGLTRQQIEDGLRDLSSVVKDVLRPLAQLEILTRGRHVLYRDHKSLVEPSTGQRFFEFDDQLRDSEFSEAESGADDIAAGPFDSKDESTDTIPFDRLNQDRFVPQTADEWYHEGGRLLADGDEGLAVEALRCCLMQEFGHPEANFLLAEALYRLGRPEAALERYYAAVESDHDYLEAWTQLGCLHEELGELNAALDAFQIALQVHPEYPDAHLHRAEILHRLERTDEAIPHWQTYLKYDDRGPWADKARQQLAEVEDIPLHIVQLDTGLDLVIDESDNS